jgi:TolB protein
VGGVNYTDSSVQNGTTYYYVTTAVDSSGNESTYSNEASANIP